MPYSVERLEAYVWRVRVGETARIVRYRKNLETFAPWDVTTADGRRLWAAFSFESAVRWISRSHGGEPIVASGLRS